MLLNLFCPKTEDGGQSHGGHPQEDVVVGVVASVEHLTRSPDPMCEQSVVKPAPPRQQCPATCLRLDGVEVSELIEPLEVGIVKTSAPTAQNWSSPRRNRKPWPSSQK